MFCAGVFAWQFLGPCLPSGARLCEPLRNANSTIKRALCDQGCRVLHMPEIKPAMEREAAPLRRARKRKEYSSDSDRKRRSWGEGAKSRV